MSYNHQPQLSVNSIQSVIEPVTPPPIGQMNNKKNHQKTQSLDLSTFNQFIENSTNSNMIPFSPNSNNNNNSTNLPLIVELNNNHNKHNNTNVSSSNNNKNGKRSNQQRYNNNGNSKYNKSKNGNKYNNNNSSPSSKYNNHKNHSSGNVNNKGNNSTALLSSNLIDDINSTPLEELDYVKLATDQFGCRFLQKKLESNSTDQSNLVRDLMLDQIKPYFINLILDPFGNYLIQKLCEYLTIDQRTILIDSIYPHVFKISINQYGTRSLQKIIDTVDNESQIDLIVKGFSAEFTSIDQIVVLINDLNGNHVIQKCIFKFPSRKFDFIINAIIEKNNIITISTHKHGCCVLQKLLSVCTLQQIVTISINIIQFLPGLINDQFGNYIIQFLLDIRELDFYLLVEIFNKLSGDLCQLSCLKFSSNVIEKFIKKLFGVVIGAVKGETYPNMTDEIMNNIMNILLTIIDTFTIKLNILIRDNFGNYALQTLLDSKNYSIILEYKGNNYILNNNPKFLNFSHDFTTKVDTLIRLTKDLLPSIKTTSYAKKIKLKVKGYSELCGIDFNDTTSNSSFNNYFSLMGSNDMTSVTTGNDNISRKQHQRHVSLPANAYHRRNSSNVLSINSTFSPLQSQQQQQQQQQLGAIQTSIATIFNSQNSSPLSINQTQQMDPISDQNMMTLSTNTATPASSGLSTQNGMNFTDDFDLTKPLANLTLNPGMTSQPLFFMNDLATTTSNNNKSLTTNNNRNVSTSSSSSNILQNNGYSSTSSTTLNSANPSNNFMTAPQTLMNNINIAYNNSTDRNNVGGNLNDFKNTTLQPQQRIVSNPFPNQNFNPMTNSNTSNTLQNTMPSQIYPNNYQNGTYFGSMNYSPNLDGSDNLVDSFGYY